MTRAVVTNVPPRVALDRWKNQRGQTVVMTYETVKVFDTEEQAQQWLRGGGNADRRSTASNEEEVSDVSGKIQVFNVDDTLRPTGRSEAPATALEREVAAELNRPGNEHIVVAVNPTTGKVSGIGKVPVPYFSKEWYDERVRKHREKGR